MTRSPTPATWMLLLGLAAAGPAFAQSAVSLFGTLDVNGRVVKADGQTRRVSESIDGLNSSQLGFRGTEDLGSGWRAGFTLLAGVNSDTGTSNTKFFNRRSTVSLFTPAGELRLGRDYVPTFLSQGAFDAFGIVGLGASGIVRQLYGGTRQDNAIQFVLPATLGGVYGNAMVAAGEGGGSGDKPGRYLGARLGYAAGPIDLAAAASQLRYQAAAVAGSVGLTGVNVGVNAVPGGRQDTLNLAAAYDFGLVKLMGYVDRETLQGARETMGSMSAIVRLGTSEIHAGYDRSRLRSSLGARSTVDEFKIGYVYNLSKRTALYANAARLDNKDATRLTLPTAAGQTTPGGKSEGIEGGIRHFF